MSTPPDSPPGGWGYAKSEQSDDLDVFNQIVQQAQRQDSLTEQLADLISVATLLGMYDAADWIRNQIAAPSVRIQS